MLTKELEELKKQLEGQQTEKETEDEELQTTDEQKPDDENATEQKEEEIKEEPKEEKKPEEKMTDSDYARIRREKSAAERKAKDEEAKRIEAENKLKSPDTYVDPEIEQINRDLAEILQEKREERDFERFKAKESAFRTSVDDYEDVSAQYVHAIVNAVRLGDPDADNATLAAAAKKIILQRSKQAEAEGYDNPVEKLYYDAKKLGFKKLERQEEKESSEEKEEVRPDHRKVSENRKRNSGMAASKGQGGEAVVTLKAAADYSPLEWSRLSSHEKQKIMYGK